MSRGRYDHFHALVILEDGREDEIEGGWTGYPHDWDDKSREQKTEWYRAVAESWQGEGLKVQEVKSFRLAG